MTDRKSPQEIKDRVNVINAANTATPSYIIIEGPMYHNSNSGIGVLFTAFICVAVMVLSLLCIRSMTNV
jgi:hypothetical protein